HRNSARRSSALQDLAAFHHGVRKRSQSKPSEARRETAENIGGKVDAEVDSRESDRKDRQPGKRVHQRLNSDRSVLHEMMGHDRIRRCGKQRMPARETVRLRQFDPPRELLRALTLKNIFE